jgi:membrane glycosyltransferase
MPFQPFRPAALDPELVTERRMRIATAVLLLVAPAVLLMADLHWRTGFDGWKVAQLLLFAILFAHLAFGAVQAATGFILRRKGGDPCQIVRTLEADDDSLLDVPVAVVMPICNEDVDRIMEGVRVIYESIAATGRLSNWDFFILSDSLDPNQWVKEETAWLALTQKLGAEGRLFYRKRRLGTNKKAGNIADFCRRWGSRYRYMVVLDADSIITGEAVTRLVGLMERNPRVGLIQAVPVLVNGETIFARVQQFASRLYGPIFSAGLNYWQLGESN